MADVDTFRNLHPQERVAGRSNYHRTFSLSATFADDTDVIRLGPLPAFAKPVGGFLWVSGTLGASVTLTLRIGTTAITAATTAASASKVDVDPTLYNPTDDGARAELNILVSGADISAGANIEVFLEWEEVPAVAVAA